MKLTVECAPLLEALDHAHRVVQKRNTIPILANVMIEVRDGKLTLTSTDMELALVEGVASAASRDGACAVPAQLLYDITRKLPANAEIELDFAGGEDQQLKLRSGRYRTALGCLPVADFPLMTSGDMAAKIAMPAKNLLSLIDRTKFAICTEETRYHLNGIYLHQADSDGTPVLRAVATDGFRLARVDEPLPEGADGMPSVIIPRKTVLELRKLLVEATGNVEIALSETLIQVRINEVLLTSKLIDGTFPEYDRVIPRSNENALRVDKKALDDAVTRVGLVSLTNAYGAVKVTLCPNLLILSSSDPGQQNEAIEEIDVDYAGEPFEVAFKSYFVTDITDQIKKTVVFEFSAQSAPAIVRDADDASALYVLMAMRA